MKKCSYCGHQNEDTAVACSECGTGTVSSPAPEADAQLSDPAGALVIVGNFGTLAQASLLATSLKAAGIEACIPEEYAQGIFSNVIPLGGATVRVAVKEFETAKAIAAGMAETGPFDLAGGALERGVDTVGEGERSRLPGPSRQAISLISVIFVVAPILFGVLAHLIRESATMGILFWLWALLSVACPFLRRFVSRRNRSMAWGCVAIGMLQLISFLVLFLVTDLPANTRSQPITPQPTRNPHNW